MLSVQKYIELSPFPLTEGDIKSLGQKDEEYIPHTWQEIKDNIKSLTQRHAEAEGDMSVLNRAPSDLRNYILWVRETRNKNDSVIGFLLRERLLWKKVAQAEHNDTQASTGLAFEYQDETPFAHPADYKILRNDWPYGLEHNIVHLVVWLKTRIPVEEDGQGGPTAESRKLIEDFVDRTFTQKIVERHREINGNCPNNVKEENVMWFKNKKKWQTVASIEHIHVILRDVDEDLVVGWTGQTSMDITARSYVWNGQ
ncbi:N-acetylglucosamine-induced protein [Trichophyton interdigitale]|nr:N-acetylglucosamine-induced protein [Trichophyton interdigitale]KAG8206474.1 N-acetylglucosamine-induced protein [Trichophyton interdigitale]